MREKKSMLEALKRSNMIALKSNKKAYILLMIVNIAMCASTFVDLAFAEYITNSAYNLFTGKTDYNAVIFGILAFTFATLIFNSLGLIKQMLNNRLMLDITYHFEGTLNDKLGSIKWEYYENNETFIKIHEVRNHSLKTIKNMVNSIIFYITVVPMAAIYAYYLSQINIFAVIIYFILVIIFDLVIAGKMFSQLGRLWEEIQSYSHRQKYFFNFSGDKITHQEYKFNRLFNYAGDLWEKCYDSEHKIKLKIFGKHEITLQTARLIFNLPYMTMMIFIGFEIVAGIHEIGFLIMANALFNNIINTCLNIQNNITNNRIESVFIKAYEEVMSYENDTITSVLPYRGNVHLNKVTYTYPQARVKALDQLDLCIKEGEKIAIVGHNGSGKTTCTNLLMALTDRYEGNITDGTKPVNLQNSISCILQDFAQYQMTIRENIEAGYVGHEFSDEEIMSILEKVGLKDVVLKLENGIDTQLGQLSKGIELSKGQWQRLAIARLLANPNATIWILDEPTAYLDPISEIEIYDMIYKISGDKTVLFISHRLGFAKRADRIIVFDKGKVAEQGTHDELMQKNGIYAEMYKIQESWYAMPSNPIGCCSAIAGS